MQVTTKLFGKKGIERELNKIVKTATKRTIARKSLKQGGEILADEMFQLAPDDPLTRDPDIKSEIGVGTKLSKTQRRKIKDPKLVEVFVGVGPDAQKQAIQQEFGNVNHSPQAFARPAWDSKKQKVLQKITVTFSSELGKSIGRQNKKLRK